MRQVKLDVIGINANPAKDDRYYMTAVPVNPADAIINPANRYGYTYDQLTSVASSMGLDNAETLIALANKGGCTVVLPCELRKVGDEFVDQRGVTRKYGHEEAGNLKPDAKDWWETDVIGSVFEWGDSAADFLNQLQLSTLTSLNNADTLRKRQDADARRRQALGRMAAAAGGQQIRLNGGVTDPLAEVVDADAEVVETNANAGGTGGGGRRNGGANANGN